MRNIKKISFLLLVLSITTFASQEQKPSWYQRFKGYVAPPIPGAGMSHLAAGGAGALFAGMAKDSSYGMIFGAGLAGSSLSVPVFLLANLYGAKSESSSKSYWPSYSAAMIAVLMAATAYTKGLENVSTTTLIPFGLSITAITPLLLFGHRLEFKKKIARAQKLLNDVNESIVELEDINSVFMIKLAEENQADQKNLVINSIQLLYVDIGNLIGHTNAVQLFWNNLNAFPDDNHDIKLLADTANPVLMGLKGVIIDWGVSHGIKLEDNINSIRASKSQVKSAKK